MVEKNDKKDHIIPSPSHYAESNAVRYCYIRAIYYGINMKIREKRRMKHSSIDQAPLKKLTIK